jgi:penicillin V acylase-like amidase (Ntn superfamily)
MCTRILYVDGQDGQIDPLYDPNAPSPNVVTGRNMDWAAPLETEIWAFPAKMKRQGGTYKNKNGDDISFTWESKYGSVISSALDACTTDGINTQGLVANLLFLVESDYDKPESGLPKMSTAAWAQYFLDSFATVKEAVVAMEPDNLFEVDAPVIPDGSNKKSTVHLSISDATGDSAIFEYVGGKLQIHHGKDYIVMTNSPTYDKQLAINEYWKNKNGMIVLPGTNNASDRFARCSFYLSAVPRDHINDVRTAIATTFSIIRNASVPIGIADPEKPNLASTLWSTVSDHKNLVYYYANSRSASVCWIDLKELDLGEGSGVRKIDMLEEVNTLEWSEKPKKPVIIEKWELGGDLTEKFVATAPFEFLPHA